MTAEDIRHRKLLFDPNLDFQEVAELPGKQVMSELRETMARDQRVCSKLIQGEHGWCFKVYGSDSRKYWLQLNPLWTADDVSNWVLLCNRCMGVRIWEAVRDTRKPLGFEQQTLHEAMATLISQYGFEQSPTASDQLRDVSFKCPNCKQTVPGRAGRCPACGLLISADGGGIQ